MSGTAYTLNSPSVGTELLSVEGTFAKYCHRFLVIILKNSVESWV